MAGAGFDYILIDTEHAPWSLESLQTTLLAFRGMPTVPIVRVPWNDQVHVKQALDVGADGVLAPMVRSAAGGARPGRRGQVSAGRHPRLRAAPRLRLRPQHRRLRRRARTRRRS